jgi:hypothetical protein
MDAGRTGRPAANPVNRIATLPLTSGRRSSARQLETRSNTYLGRAARPPRERSMTKLLPTLIATAFAAFAFSAQAASHAGGAPMKSDAASAPAAAASGAKGDAKPAKKEEKKAEKK